MTKRSRLANPEVGGSVKSLKESLPGVSLETCLRGESEIGFGVDVECRDRRRFLAAEGRGVADMPGAALLFAKRSFGSVRMPDRMRISKYDHDRELGNIPTTTSIEPPCVPFVPDHWLPFIEKARLFVGVRPWFCPFNISDGANRAGFLSVLVAP